MRTKQILLLMLMFLVVVLGQNAFAFYSPQTGRWLCRDPLASSMNDFRFVGNHSISAWDYLGLVEGGIITIGEIPECAQALAEWQARLEKRGIMIKGRVSKTVAISAEELHHMTGLAIAHLAVDLIAHEMYEIIGAKLEERAKNVFRCKLINDDAASHESPSRSGFLLMEDYAIRSEKFWGEGTHVQYYLKYFACGGNTRCKYWGAVCWLPTKDFKDFRMHVIFDCGGDKANVCPITVPLE